MNILIRIILILSLISCANDWRTARKDSAGIAPKPSELKEDIIQIYTARAFNWRGVFAVHPWISWKLKDEEHYTVAQVIGFRLKRTGRSIVMQNDLPDRYWYGSMPELIFELRGDKANKAITRVKELIASYPYADQYRVWPGPNSNTFVAYLIRHTDELDVELPPHAIGKDWLVNSYVLAPTASSTGYQFSFLGVLGLSVGLAEGIEFNILGLNFGIDLWTPALKLPFVGRLGFKDKSIK